MAYCPECGSEVAEIDVFCPFCGISLQSFMPANEANSFNKTIITPPSDEERHNKKEESTDREIIETKSAAAEPVENADNDFDQKIANQNTSENWTVNTKSVEIPGELLEKEPNPEKISDINAFNDFDDIQTTQNKEDDYGQILESETDIKIENKTEVAPPIFDQDLVETEDDFKLESDDFERKSVDEISQRTDEVENSSAVKTGANDNSYDESEIKDFPSPDEPELISAEKIQPPPPDFTKTIPYVAPSTVKGSFIGNNDEFSLIDEKEEFSADIAPQENESDLSAAKPAIEKPAEVLPEIEYPASKFDSVSIMEKNEPEEAKAPSSFENSAVKPQKVSDVESFQLDSKSPVKENHSHTSPNMGIGDTDGKKKAKLQPLEEGTILNGRYEIVRKIGGGGMGAVYLASDKNLGGVLRAVKEMVQSYIEETQQDKAISDFKRESMLLTSLEHQSIPTIYDYFFDEKEARFYLVMKYISGGDLASRIRWANQGRIDEKDVTEWAIQIADVLDYLHNRQPPIVYRDLKPANIMIDGNSGRVMLIDFGIARWINKEEKGVTAVGTMGYAPPELFSGNVESRSDIYSLGSTMFHLLTGADPQSNPLLIFDFQKHPRPRQINPQLSDQMEKILMQSVEYNAEMRFKTAGAMRQALENHLSNLKANKVTYGAGQNAVSTGLAEEFVFCGFCGQKIVASDMFCAFCGAKQPLLQHGGSSDNYISAPITARLMIVGTNELETPAYKIEKDENLVGRRDPMSNIFPEVDLSKYDPQTKISRRHARIWRDGKQFMVEDLGSSNGTVVLPVTSETVRLLPHQPYALTNGDKLRLGDTTLHFIIG